MRLKIGSHIILFDREDAEMVLSTPWHVIPAAGGGFYVASVRYGALHRAIKKAKKGQRVDHRNNNGLDNRRQNLRFCTRSQNSANSIKPRRGNNRYKGVRRNGKKSWMAVITCQGKSERILGFANEKDAALAYDEAARRLFGEFACVNFPRKGEQSAFREKPKNIHRSVIRTICLSRELSDWFDKRVAEDPDHNGSLYIRNLIREDLATQGGAAA